MQYTIYAPGEIRRKIFLNKKDVLVLVRCAHRVALLREDDDALWTTPMGSCEKGEKPDDAALRIVREALGCETLELRHLCDYVCKEKKKRAVGGRAYLADVAHADGEGVALLDRMPAADEVLEPGLLLGVYQWAGDLFDDDLEIDRLCWPLPRNGA